MDIYCSYDANIYGQGPARKVTLYGYLKLNENSQFDENHKLLKNIHFHKNHLHIYYLHYLKEQ